MTTLVIIGIVILYLGIFMGVWSWSYLRIKRSIGCDETDGFVGGFFIGLFWPVSAIAFNVRRLLDCWIK